MDWKLQTEMPDLKIFFPQRKKNDRYREHRLAENSGDRQLTDFINTYCLKYLLLTDVINIKYPVNN